MILVLNYGKWEIGWFSLLRLVFWTFMLYEIFVQVFWLLYTHRMVGFMGLALGCLVYFCLLAKTEFSCWTFVSCLKNVFLWRVDVILYWCALVSCYDMLMWLMCCNVCWILSRLSDKNCVEIIFVYIRVGASWSASFYFIYSLLIKKCYNNKNYWNYIFFI